jgi:DNA-binding NtrC family response regulator
MYLLEQHSPGACFTDRALRLLESQPWRGNIRELRNVIMKAAVLHADREPDRGMDTQIDADDLPVGATPASSHADVPAFHNGASLEGMERRMIFDALAATGGHQQRAAARLGISRRTLSRKLKTYEAERARAAL